MSNQSDDSRAGDVVRAVLIVAILAILGALVGCKSNSEGEIFGYGNVHEHALADGTRCAVLDSYYGGGITCDWDSPQAPTARAQTLEFAYVR
jgi:hypothetical protein